MSGGTLATRRPPEGARAASPAGAAANAGSVPGAMALVVQKFGGTSVADPDRIRAVAEHVARTIRRGDTVVLVVSAMGK
ncbi:hypothetical protein B7486_69295, partial [cyanobacterium TDX16]